MQKQDVFTVGDLRKLLAPVSLIRRKAIMFCLESGLTPDEVSRLTWKKAFKLDLSPLAREIVRSMPRHIRLSYVFWEYLHMGIASPLFCLEDSIKEACCGRGFEVMKKAYDNMVLIDTYADAEDFKNALASAT